MTDQAPERTDAVLNTAVSLRAATDKLERLATGLSGLAGDCPHRQRRLAVNGVLMAAVRELADSLDQQPDQWVAYQSPNSRAAGRGHSPAPRYWRYMTSVAESFAENGEQAFALDLDGTAFDLLSLAQDAMAWVVEDAYPDHEKPWWPGLNESQTAIH